MLKHGKGESTGMEEVHMKTEAETGVMPSQAQELQGDQKLQDQGGASPGAFGEGMAPPTPRFQTSDICDICERIHFFWFKLTSLCQFVTQT